MHAATGALPVVSRESLEVASATRSSNERIVRIALSAADRLLDLADHTTHNRAARLIDDTRLAAWNAQASLTPILGVDHPAIVGMQQHLDSLKDLVDQIRATHGTWDPWTPGTSENGILHGAADYFTGVAEAHRDGALRGPLQQLHEELLATTADTPQLQALRDEALALVDRNLKRQAGIPLTDAPQGYGGHPDYAELGRIRATIDLLTPTTDGLAW